MSRKTLGAVILASIAAALLAPSAALAVSIQSAGSPYTGPVNLRQSSATAKLTASTGSLTCTSSGGRLASFGTGSVSTSTLTTSPVTVGSLSRLSFGSPLLANSSNTHDSTTSVLTSGSPNSTPRCASTIMAISGGCTAETSSAIPVSAYYTGTNGFVRVQLTITLYCRDGSGNPVTCNYTTGSTPGTPGPVTSDPIPFNAAGVNTASTATFTNVPVYRSSGSSLCPSTATFTASYQLFTGLVYGGASNPGVAIFIR